MENQTIYPEVSMKWHKLLTRFLLWLGALSNVITGCLSFAGLYSQAQYSMVPGLRGFEILLAIIALGMAVLGIYTAVKLIRYSSRGPAALTRMYIVGIASQLLQLVAGLILVGGQYVNVTNFLSGLVTSVVMLSINKKYYENRAHLFVND